MQLNRCPILIIGHAGYRALVAMRHGHVVAAFRRSVYVETDRGDMVCLGPVTLGAGPLNALCKFPQTMAMPELDGCHGSNVEKRGDVLHTRRFAFPLAGATLWEPPDTGASRTHDKLGRTLDKLGRVIAKNQLRGFGELIPALLGSCDTLPRKKNDLLLARAWQATNAFSRWLHAALTQQDVHLPIPKEVENLIGLGPGLTPAGDDFLGGALIALRSLAEHALADRIKDWILPLARTQTNRISLAHLRCAAAGEGAAVLHNMLAALNSQRGTALTPHLDALDGIGHSSGWDTLAGVICAYTTYVAARRSADRRELTFACS
jgi:hypothetical protein